MNRAKNLLRSRLSLLALLLFIFAIALAGSPQPAAMAACPDAAYVTYYNNANHSMVVGRCSHACCKLWSCTGQITNYYTVVTFTCDFQ